MNETIQGEYVQVMTPEEFIKQSVDVICDKFIQDR